MGNSPSYPPGVSVAEFNRMVKQFETSNAEMRKQMQKQYDDLMAEKKREKKEFNERMDRMEQQATKERNEMYRKHQQQMDQQAAENKRNIESIMNKNAADQKAALKVHQEQSEKALKEQKDMFNRLENERKEAAKKEMDMMRVSHTKLTV